MSKFFEPVEFELGEDPGKPTPPKPAVTFNPDKVKEVVAEIRKEFERIRTGTSELCHYAFDPGRFANPLGENLKRFETDPTEKTMAGFLQIAKQDVGLRAAVHWLEQLESAKEKSNG